MGSIEVTNGIAKLLMAFEVTDGHAADRWDTNDIACFELKVTNGLSPWLYHRNGIDSFQQIKLVNIAVSFYTYSDHLMPLNIWHNDV